MKDRSQVERFLPFGYFACVMLLVAFLLPTTLRPPPQQPPTTAELSPDSPPNDEILLTQLNQGRSSTAGATLGGAAGLASPVPSLPPVPSKARKAKCFGNPPRQIESLYAPPCAPAFTGDNGGSTWRGVSKDDIKVAFMMSLTGNASRDGELPDEPTDNESAVVRTYRVLKAYFNQNFEFYGRKLRFYYVQDKRDDSDPTVNRAAAARAVDQYGVFAAINETSIAALDELTRRGVVTFTLAQANRDFYAKHRPYAWSTTPDSTTLVELGAEYLCKKLAGGRPPKYTDDPTVDQRKPRVFGILAYNEGTGYSGNADLMETEIKKCGVTSAQTVKYSLFDGDASQAQISTAIAKMKAAGVTTIISLQDFVSNYAFTSSADQASYYPEWFLPGFGGMDLIDDLFQTYPATQWRHAFGFSMYEVPTRQVDEECYRAYHTIDPDNNPDDNMCYYMFVHMVQLFGAMQLAGPKLTPDSVQAGLFKYGYHAPKPAWRMAGGYGPGDWSYADYLAEIWYDPLAPHPNGNLGAYHFIRGGARYKRGEVPPGDAAFFTDPGITEAPRT